jgi:L-threonylcarbamoyladenylate synthase
MRGETVALHPGSPNTDLIERAAGLIKDGGVIVYPTETLYGLGADAGNAGALRRIYEIKGREEAKPVLVIVDAFETLLPFVRDVTNEAQSLMLEFWPGPLTLVFKASKQVSAELTAGTGTIGARVPSSEFCRALVRACRRPITSTSANRAGDPPLATIEEICRSFPHGVDLFIDGGRRLSGAPSTVIDVTSSPPRLLREGVVHWDEIQQILHRDI